jgi:hypothetical protein
VRKERAEVAWGKKEHVKSCGLEKEGALDV